MAGANVDELIHADGRCRAANEQDKAGGLARYAPSTQMWTLWAIGWACCKLRGE